MINTREEWNDAVAKLADAARAYYLTDVLTMMDSEYDELLDEVQSALAENPEWDPDGKVFRVAGGALGVSDGDVAHTSPMLSLDKAKTVEALRKHFAGYGNVPVVVEPKMDGVALSARYVDGRLDIAALRGDGTSGKNVTGRIVSGNVQGLPLTLPEKVTVELRGEVYMSDSDFVQANTARIEAGYPGFANPRNAVSGSLHRDDNPYVANMSFAVYDVTGGRVDHIDSYLSRMRTIQPWGFTPAVTLVEAFAPAATVKRYSDVQKRVDVFEKRRGELGFPIDGAVIKVDSHKVREQLGFTSGHPKWAVAYKYAPDTVTTTVEEVLVRVGRTGQLGIRMRFVPVHVGGSTVTFASGHNVSWMTAQRLGAGSKVYLYRSGDVIPYATAFPLDQQPVTAVPWTPPTECPTCHQPWNTDTLMWRCETSSCGLVGALTYFCSSDTMDVERIGVAVCEALVEEGLVEDVADLYTLTEEQYANLPLGTTSKGAVKRLGAANAKVIMAELEKSKKQPFHRVVAALGVRGTGRRVSQWLAAEYPTMGELLDATREDIASMDRLKDKKAEMIVSGLEANREVIRKLAAAGVNMGGETVSAVPSVPQIFAGETYVVSGSVPGFTRNTLNEAIEKLGGKTSTSVTRGTTKVVTSETSTSKAKKAKQLNIPVIDPAEFAVTVTNALHG